MYYIWDVSATLCHRHCPTVLTNNTNLKLMSIIAEWKIRNRSVHNEETTVNNVFCKLPQSEWGLIPTQANLVPRRSSSGCGSGSLLLQLPPACNKVTHQHPEQQTAKNAPHALRLHLLPKVHTIWGVHSSGDFCVSTLRAANKWTVFKCPPIASAVFFCMQFSILYISVCTTVISTIKGIPLPATSKPTHFIFSNKVCKNAK